MKSTLLRSLAVTIFLATSATSSFAGAWTAKQGAFYDKMSFNYYYAHETFDTSGKRSGTPNNGKFTDYNLSNYFEYGLLDNLTVINSLSYKWLENDNDSALSKGYGLGDADLGLRYKLLDSELITVRLSSRPYSK